MKIHFVAIGGSVMHQLAIALKMKGYDVSGSDDEIFDPAAGNLKDAGIYPDKMGWYPERITSQTDAVILGMHAKGDNPELLKATELNIPVYSFPEYIYKESVEKERVAVAGSHGKTTITSMIMHVLHHSRIDFDYLVGSSLAGFEQSVRITDARLIVCEADEYPASTVDRRPKFLFLLPHIAVISGIAWDHMNVFPTFEIYCSQFADFIERIEPDGVLIYNESDDVLLRLVKECRRKDIQFVPYQMPEHHIAEGITYVDYDGLSTPLQVFGDHNLLNLSAAWQVCSRLGVNDARFLHSIASFTGAARRLELIDHHGTTRVYRDFAHSPSKVTASTKALKRQFPGKRMVAVLELHTFSSLNRNFMKEYHGALDEADVPIIFYSRHALELKRMPFLDPEFVKSGFANPGLSVFTDREELGKTLEGMATDDTNFLFMSSGDYDGLDILKSLRLK